MIGAHDEGQQTRRIHSERRTDGVVHETSSAGRESKESSRQPGGTESKKEEQQMNQMVAVGNATEIQVRFTKSGQSVASFSIAMKSKKGDEIITTWQKVEAWGELAENLAETVGKGDRVFAVGRIKTDEYTTKEGEKRSTVVLVADEAGVSLRWSRKNDDD